MPEKFLKPYNPQESESAIYKKWEESGYFNPDNIPTRLDASGEPVVMKPYTIVMPPPNANGNLHAGHALFITLEDIFTRFKRMQGYRALWIPGADHAGFETQVVYEKQLEKEGRSRFGMDPTQLYKEIYDFTMANKENMESQVRALGASCDWSRKKFTLDPDVVATVQKTFVDMYNDGLIYRGNRTINWCSKHQTSLSDVETESVEDMGQLYYFQYGPFTIATSRPETKFGDKYVVMHPDDTRYELWKHGDQLELEWINGPIIATVIKDSVIDMAFGTGVMTITPWHDAVDFDIAKRHDLPFEQVIDLQGKLLPIAGEFAGQKIAVARAKIVEKLRTKGLVVKTDERYQHITKHCYKCNTLIEPQILPQWFVKMRPLGDLALASVDAGEVTFIPDNFEKIFRFWMENTLDWNISRQIVWGIPIPAWLCDTCTGHAASQGDTPPLCATCSTPMRKDSDTFDTWFSSGQWPLIVTGYPNGRDFARHYPTDVMETGHDLIFKWVPRMVIFGLYLGKKAPFHTVYLHGLVNDAKGKKMSKSKGNVINPLDLTLTYGTDALRMGLIIGNTPGADLALSEEKIKGYKHFANKIWNITRFVLENAGDADMDTPLVEKDVTCSKEFKDVAYDITKDLEEFRVYMAAEKLYHYVWDTFASNLLEESKFILKTGSPEEIASRKTFLTNTLHESLKLLHPFMPFVTEEIWQTIPRSQGDRTRKLLMVESWPVTLDA